MLVYEVGRLVSSELCIDQYHDAGYWKFLHETPMYRIQAREYCRRKYEDLFVEYEWLSEMY